MKLQTSSDTCEVRFELFDLREYELFLKAKRIPEYRTALNDAGISTGLIFPARFAAMIGVSVEKVEQERLPLPDFLFDDQREIVKLALDAKRFAIWKDCGLGKTLEQLEWARQVNHITGGRVLIMTLNEVVDQTIEEALKFYGPGYHITRLESREVMRAWCANGSGIAITNYEKMNPTDGCEVVPEMGLLAGVALDESSRLKTGGGKQKWALIKSCRGVQYKLSCTATPAPNDVMEFASQASFLERIRDEHDVIWTYFSRNPKTNEWTVKRHARPHFFRWMASWSIYVADPRTYGWRLNMPDVPQPEFFYEELPCTAEQSRLFCAQSSQSNGTADLFGDKRLGMVNQLTLLEAAKGFVYGRVGEDASECRHGIIRVDSRKPHRVAQIAAEQLRDNRQTLIWCEYDGEVEVLSECLRDIGIHEFVALGGSTPKAKRAPILNDFRHGKLPLLVSKAKLLGWGMNFQNCTSMIFSGFSDSFESFYQAVRRSYRYGQTQRLRVFIPYIPQLEGPVLRNLLNKVDKFGELIRSQEQAYLAARRELA